MRTTLLLCLLATAFAVAGKPPTRARTEINIPDIPGFVTLKCDFHMHTIFSDGQVWPTVRVEEAWREGLDAIAITDHIEYLSHLKDVTTATNRNRSVDIARPTGADLDIIVIRGSEITRKMPPGHFNAIFLTNSPPLVTTDWRDAVKGAHKQGAFIFWNHPGWENQLQEDKVVRWYPEHSEVHEQGMLGGIEVVNGREYYPEAHRWALEKKLTMLSNSDIHAPLNMDYHVHSGDHRPLTLVFAKERSAESIKDALVNRRTAVYSSEKLIGEEKFLKPLFEKSIQIKNPKISVKGKARAYVQIANHSDISYKLERERDLDDVKAPKELTLAAGKTVLLELQAKSPPTTGRRKWELPYRVANLLVAPDEPLRTSIVIEASFGFPTKQ